MSLALNTALLILICNCAKPTGQFWIDGLALPPGARVSSRQETTTDQYVVFNYPDDWEPVEGYFNDTLIPLGFKVAQDGDEATLLHTRHASWDYAQVEQARADIQKQLATLTGIDKPRTRLYLKRGSSYCVYLLDLDDKEASAEGRPAYGVLVTRGEPATPAQSKQP